MLNLSVKGIIKILPRCEPRPEPEEDGPLATFTKQHWSEQVQFSLTYAQPATVEPCPEQCYRVPLTKIGGFSRIVRRSQHTTMMRASMAPKKLSYAHLR